MKPWMLFLSLILASCRTTSEPQGAAARAQPAPGGASLPQEQRVFLADSLDESVLAEVAANAPGLRIVNGLNPETALEWAPRADGADIRLITPEFLELAADLAWIQIGSAGVERYLARPEIRAASDRVVLTNAAGVHGPVIAEHVFAMLLSQTRSLRAADRAQTQRRWDRSVGAGSTALSGSTLLVVGMGGIGTEVARRAKAFDMRVLATVRTEREAPPFVDRLVTGDRLDELLGEADVVVICVPLTPETRGLFGRERIARMKPGSRLVNIARGAIVDSGALLDALATGALAGACLDVTDPEPLPAEHGLWEREDVVITPHVAGRAELTSERRNQLFAENLIRFAAGEPLRNTVDPQAGY
jgi:phosphoglycerate dehydrogenase-like enzyme